MNFIEIKKIIEEAYELGKLVGNPSAEYPSFLDKYRENPVLYLLNKYPSIHFCVFKKVRSYESNVNTLPEVIRECWERRWNKEHFPDVVAEYAHYPPILTKDIFEEILEAGAQCDCYEHKIMQHELLKKYNLENKDE